MRALVFIVFIVVIAGCQGHTTQPAPAPVAAPAIDAKPIDAGTKIDAARRTVGKLNPPHDPQKLWPWRVCVDGHALVFENDCGCNDALLCTLDGVGLKNIAYTLATDPNRMPQCTDCFPMVPARCALPPAKGWRTVTINNEPAFELPPDAPDASCWEATR
ncbi:MAG TPA: hypothetical protein VL463_06620 [Kofleriaceae bacterium]|nr:hypothetical protein [Kofleriaceae bacterium]